MHELGVVFHALDIVERVAKENRVGHVNRVTILLGEVSTVVPELLLDCWKWAVEKRELTTGCRLDVERIEAVTKCSSCGAEYSTVKYAKICPECGSADTYLLRGNEFMIKDIEVSAPEEE